MRDLEIVGVHAQDADGAVEDAPAGVDDVVGDPVAAGRPRRAGLARRRAVDLHPAGAQVAQDVSRHAQSHAPRADFDPIPAHALDDAVLHGAVARAEEAEHAGNVAGGLRGGGVAAAAESLAGIGVHAAGLLAGVTPIGVAEGQPPEADVFDESPRLGLAPEDEKLQESRRPDLCVRRSLTPPGQVVQPPRRTVEIPLSRLGQRLEDVVHVVVRQLRAVAADQRRPAGSRHRHQASRRVEGRDPRALLDPVMDVHDLGVGQVPEGFHVPRRAHELRLPATAPARRQRQAGSLRHAEKPLLRTARTRRGTPINEEAAEVPPPRRDLGQVGNPGLSAVQRRDTPSGDALAAVEDRTLAAPRRKGGRPRVLQRQAHRRREGIDPAAHPHRHRAVEGSRILQRAQLPHRALQGAQRAVGPLGVRARPLARPRVLAVRRQVEVHPSILSMNPASRRSEVVLSSLRGRPPQLLG